MVGRIINLCGGVYKVLLDDKEIINVKARGKLRAVKKLSKNGETNFLGFSILLFFQNLYRLLKEYYMIQNIGQ